MGKRWGGVLHVPHVVGAVLQVGARQRAREVTMKELILFDFDNNKTKTGIDLNNLDDVLRIDICVISGDEIARITYKNGDIKVFDGTTEPRHMDFDDGEYCIYQAGVKNDIDEWLKRKNSYDW